MSLNRMLAAALLPVCLVLLSGAARADAPSAAEAEQYVVYLSSDAPQSGLSAVPYADGYYLADSVEEVAPLLAQGSVELLVRNEGLTLLDAPNDPEIAKQWYLDALGMDALWDSGLTGEGVTVAVIDSGVYAGHEDFAAADIDGYNFLGTGEQPEAYGDDSGHGTLVAGILAAGRDNGIYGTGLVPQVSLLALRCFSADAGSANSGSGELDTVLSAIGWAIEQGADVINMSLGGTGSHLRALEPILQQAADAGILTVAAVGNKGGTALYYPAAFDCVTGVGGTDENGEVAAYSQHNESVFVTAPGSNIYGLWRTASGEGKYERTGSGTSFAAPMVSALAVMAKQRDRAIDCAGFQRLLRDCAQDRGAEGWDEYYGYGAVSAAAFVAALDAPQPIVYECGADCSPGEDWPSAFFIGQGDACALPEDPQREGWVFGGWYLSENCEGEALCALPAGSVGEVTLYAKWEPGEASLAASCCVNEDGETCCTATVLCAGRPGATACAARYDAEGRFLGCETLTPTQTKTIFTVPCAGAACLRFFLLDADGAPLCPCAVVTACTEPPLLEEKDKEST